MTMVSLLSNQILDQPQHFPWLGMTVQLQLRIEQLSIGSHFKATAIRRHERDRLDHMLIILEQFICQAHGPTSVVSDRAVNDLYFQHVPSTRFEIITETSEFLKNSEVYELGNSRKNARTVSSAGRDLICFAVPTCRSIPSTITAMR